MTSEVRTEHSPQVSAKHFLAAFRTAAEALKAELIPIWRKSTTDAPYTAFMAAHVFPATARGLNLQFSPEYSYTDTAMRSRRLDGAVFAPGSGMRLQDVLVAIELENKEQTLSDEIDKLASLRVRLCVLFFYSNEATRERRISEVRGRVKTWAAASSSEFLIMWNRPYQAQPHWRPCLVTATGTEELPLFTII